MELNWTNVDATIKECLLDDVQDRGVIELLEGHIRDGIEFDDLRRIAGENGVIIVPTIMQRVGFSKARLDEHAENIRSMFTQLDESFYESKGGGMSFLRLPFRADETQWGEQWQADMFYALGAAIGIARFSVEDRSIWAAMPGGLPYITVSG